MHNVIMNSIIQFFELYALQVLVVHIACGFLSLSSAFVDGIYTCANGARAHTRANKTHRFLWTFFHSAMTGVSITAIILSIITMPPNYFLLSIALFTFYMVITALRSLFGGTMRTADKALAIAMLIVGGAMVGSGIYYTVIGRPLVSPLIVFGAVGIIFGIADMRIKRGAPTTSRFLARNFGTLIAALTAFLVVNIELPGAWQVATWVVPTGLGSLMISYLYRVSLRNKGSSSFAERIRTHVGIVLPRM